MSSSLVRNTITTFLSLSSIDQYKSFFKQYDIMILVILFIRIENKLYWSKLWGIIYDLQKTDSYELFFQNLKKNNLFTQDDFLGYMNTLYDDIVTRK
jgi:hypothetical protein